jgi:hypothetical protein
LPTADEGEFPPAPPVEQGPAQGPSSLDDSVEMDLTETIDTLATFTAPSTFEAEDSGDDMQMTQAVGSIHYASDSKTEVAAFDRRRSEAMEMTVAVGSIIHSASNDLQFAEAAPDEDSDGDDMQMTQAVGSIHYAPAPAKPAFNRRRSEAMEMTMGVGAIIQAAADEPEYAEAEDAGALEGDSDDGDDMPMTQMVGGYIEVSADHVPDRPLRRKSEAMEMTMGVGSILAQQGLGSTETPERNDVGNACRVKRRRSNGTSAVTMSPEADASGTANREIESFDTAESAAESTTEKAPTAIETFATASPLAEFADPATAAPSLLASEEASSGVFGGVQLSDNSRSESADSETQSTSNVMAWLNAETPPVDTAQREGEGVDSMRSPVAVAPSPVQEAAPAGPAMDFGTFLSEVNVRFLDRVTSKRRTTMLGPSFPTPNTTAEITRAGALLLPQVETYEWGCEYLSGETRQLKQDLGAEEVLLNTKPPPVFTAVAEADDEQLDQLQTTMSRVKSKSRQVAKGTWHTWRLKLETTLSETLASEQQAVDIDSSNIENIVARVQSKRDKVAAMKQSLVEQNAALKAKILSDEGSADLAKQVVEMQHMQAKCTELEHSQGAVKEQKDALADRLQELTQKLSTLQAETAEVDTEIERIGQLVTTETVTEAKAAYLLYGRMHVWQIAEMSATGTSFDFGRFSLAFAFGNREENDGGHRITDFETNAASHPTVVPTWSMFPATPATSKGLGEFLEIVSARAARHRLIEQQVAQMALLHNVTTELSGEDSVRIKCDFVISTKGVDFTVTFAYEGLNSGFQKPSVTLENRQGSFSAFALKKILGNGGDGTTNYAMMAVQRIRDVMLHGQTA